MNYDHIRYVYQTPISRYGRDALAKAAQQAVERAVRWHGAHEVFAYRVIDATYSVCVDPDGDVFAPSTQMEIIAFPVVKQTDHGFRIRRGGSEEHPETRWVSFNWHKSWASLTPEGAVKDFAARKSRQASIYTARALKAENLRREAQQLLGGATWPV